MYDTNAESLADRILYRDALILVLNKPAGIAVHRTKGGTYNLEEFFHTLQFGLPRPPTLAHRLDWGTSGCLVLARHRRAAQRMGVLFAESRIKKTYWAVVAGEFSQSTGARKGCINLPLSKQSVNKQKWRMKVDSDEGLSALTNYEVLEESGGLTWLELSPQTGRTHQLRVHCAALGHSIIGDHIYGLATGMGSTGAGSQVLLHLHARGIEIPLYPKKHPLKIEANPPAHMSEALTAFRLSADRAEGDPLFLWQ